MKSLKLLSLGKSRAQPHHPNRRRRVTIVTLASCHLERVSHLDQMFCQLMEKFLVLFYEVLEMEGQRILCQIYSCE